MHVTVGTVYTIITSAKPWELKNIHDALTFRVENAHHMPRVRSGQWDGMQTFLWTNRKTGEPFFFTGLLHLLESSTNEIVVKKPLIEDLTYLARPDLLKTVRMDGKWSYQERTIREALEHQRGIWWLATGAGKTFIAGAVIEALRLPTLFLVPRLELMKQTADVFQRELSVPVGWLGGGEDVAGLVVVGIVNSIRNRSKKDPAYLPAFEMVIADECHLSSASSYVDILTQCVGADYRFGLSGTPLELDMIRNVRLTGMLGPVISHVSNKELIALGVNAKPIIHMHKVTQSSGVATASDWASLYKANITENLHRNMVIVSVVRESFGEGLTTLVLVHSIKHGELLERMLNNVGVATQFCSGKSTKALRFDQVDGLREGRYKVLILSKIGEVGLDIPALDVVVRASGGKSTISTLQALGRGLRGKVGKPNVVYYHDFWDTLDKYGRRHSRQRVRDYEAEGFEVLYV